jgi:glycosyltransferase involved in cell wall biosynthesis
LETGTISTPNEELLSAPLRPADMVMSVPGATAAGECREESPEPRILYVLSCWPHDQAYGGQLRALHLARALARVGRVTLAVVGADPVDAASRARTEAEFPVAGEWSLEPAKVRGLRALAKSFFDRGFVNIHGVALSPASENEIVSLIRKQFDLVWFCGLRTANYFRQARWTGSVVDVDNLPGSATDTRGDRSGGFMKRLRGWIWNRALRKHERQLGARFDAVAVCSEADRVFLGDPRIRVIPNGFARPAGEPVRDPADPPRIGFIGLLEYEPNREGVCWFLEHCWPALREAIPGIQFRLAGKGAGEVVKNPVAGVEVLGWVEDAAAEIATWSLTIIPIRSGAGTRIKIADAFSRKCPAVSTSLGAYGYEVQDKGQLRLADTPEAFTAACLDLLRDPAEARRMADRAWAEFLKKWTWDAIEPKVREAAEAALKVAAAGPRHALEPTPAGGKESIIHGS